MSTSMSTPRSKVRFTKALLATLALVVGGAGLTTEAATAAPRGLRVVAPGGAGYGFGSDGSIFAVVPIYMAAYGEGVEFHVGRSSYNRPVKVTKIVVRGDEAESTVLDPDLIDGFLGFRRGLRVVVRDTAGDVVYRDVRPWCPGGYDRQRVDPTGPANPVYPSFCSGSPFTRGTVWGIEQGWATPLLSDLFFDGNDTEYTVTVRLTARLARALEVPKGHRRATVPIVVEQSGGPVEGNAATDQEVGPDASREARVRPAATTRAPRPDTLPDLISLPAYWISASHDPDGRDRINFAANEWNAGPGTLVVEGYRSAGEEDLMDAYQVFYRDGEAVLALPTGTMEFHDAPEHMHWHFLDFAKYELVDEDGAVVTTSGKQSWCLAPTDAIDLRVDNAVYRPEVTGLSSSCGSQEALWLREVMPVGWGDTYTQFQTQAMDITDLPNGTYRIKVTVNPDGNLFEVTEDNNVSFRTVIVGGLPGARTVEVPPVGLVDSESQNPFGRGSGHGHAS